MTDLFSTLPDWLLSDITMIKNIQSAALTSIVHTCVFAQSGIIWRGEANIITDASLKYIIYTILIVLSALLGGMVFMKPSVAKLEKINFHRPQYHTISLDDEQVKIYIGILEHTLNTTKIYLRPGLSLSELSLMTNIPKHHFSNLLNMHIGKAFYQYISEYRIQEAISRIENDDNITVESLSYECGFNSKTSFNRYFKSVTGCTPSEYRKIKMLAH